MASHRNLKGTPPTGVLAPLIWCSVVAAIFSLPTLSWSVVVSVGVGLWAACKVANWVDQAR